MKYFFCSAVFLLALDKTNSRTYENEIFQAGVQLLAKNFVQGPFQETKKNSSLLSLDFTNLNTIYLMENFFFGDIERDTYFTMQAGLEPDVSIACIKSLREFATGLRETRLWAIHMVDSFGKMPSGMLAGTFAAFGDFDMCVDTIVPGKFQGRYCRMAVGVEQENWTYEPRQPYDLSFVYNTDVTRTLMSFNLRSQSKSPFETSICLPSTCATKEIPHILSKINRFTAGLQLSIKECTIKTELNFTFKEILIIALITAFIFMELVATVLDIRLRDPNLSKVEISTPMKCLLCFSFYTNVRRLFKEDNNPDSIKVFHGMKVISMVWLILGHTIIINLKVIGRLFYALQMAGGFFFQIAINPYVAIETFFFISGFLVLYSFIKVKTPRISIFLYALYRYWRLMPPVVFMILFTSLLVNTGSGPLWKEFMIDYLIGTCSTSWWKNILFINNYSGTKNNCLPWTWYVAVDMQLYLAAYFILLLYRRNASGAMRVVKAIAFASIFITAANHIYYRLPPQPAMNYVQYTDADFFTKIAHFRTYNHILPYCVGMITAYLVLTKKEIKINWGMKCFAWILSFVFGVTVVFATYLWNSGRPATLLESTLYGSFHRLIWSLMLLWVVHTCIRGEGGVVSSFLSWKGFVPLSRLSYMVFLVHPVLQYFIFSQVRTVVLASRLILTYMFISTTVLSYMLAFVFCLICESPFMGLLNLILASKVGKNEKVKKKENFLV